MSKPRIPADPRIELLPGQLRPVAEICGFDGVERLIEAFGGMRLYVASPGNGGRGEVARRCGSEVADALSRCFGGEYLVVPLARTLKAAQRREEIRNDPRDANEVARAYGMSVGSVYRLRGGRPGPGGRLPSRNGRRSRQDDRVIDIEEMIDRAGRRGGSGPASAG